MTTEVTIIGAGMAGLLAANMLRHRDPVILEAQKSLPNNHHALLRFRSSVVGDVLDTMGLLKQFSVTSSEVVTTGIILVVIGTAVGAIGSALAVSRFLDV